MKTFGVNLSTESKNLLILGAGQYGILAKEIAESMGCFTNIAFLDDSYKVPEKVGELAKPTERPSIIGTTRDIAKFVKEFHYAFVAIGNPDVRRLLVEQVLSKGMCLATLVHPAAYISPSAQLQKGVCIEPNATVQTNAVVGQASFISSGAVIRHDASVGEYCHVDCNAVVQTGAVVPVATKISCNSVFSKVKTDV